MKYYISVEMDGKENIDALVKAIEPISKLPHVSSVCLAKVEKPVWHDKTVEAETHGEKDEVPLIVFRTVSSKPMIESIPYCPMRDGKWEEFVYCFRILFWSYEKDLYEQAESEAKNENH